MPGRMVSRRDAVKYAAALSIGGGAVGPTAAEDPKKLEPKTVAAVLTEYRPGSHADVLIGKILEGWKQDRGPGPALKLAAMYVDQFACRHAKRQFDAARIIHVPTDTIQLWSVAALIARVLRIGRHTDRLEPRCPALDDVRHAAQRLDVVHNRRLAKQSFDGRKWRLDPRPGPFAFQAFNEPRFFAADIGPCPAVQVNL